MIPNSTRPLPPTDEELDAELASLGASAADFLPVDTSGALDVEARISATPLEKETRGMFMEQMARAAREVGVHWEQHYLPFNRYPLRGSMRLLSEYAPAKYPELPLREGIRRAGRQAFSTLMDSVAGRVLFVLARRDVLSMLRLAPDAYSHNLSHCSVTLRLEASRQIILEYREVWNFPECYHVGVIEGACRTFGVDPRVRTRIHSPCDLDMLIRW